MPDWLWRWSDIAYRWLHGVEDLPGDGQTVIRIGVGRHRGRRVALKDGTLVHAGDLVGTIHFNNESVAAIHKRTANPIRAGILILRAFEDSLETLAGLVETCSPYREVKAFTATTIFYRGVERLGFEIFPPRSALFGRVVAAYERSLLVRFHPLGASRVRRKRFAEVRVIWISRAALCRRYAARRSSPSGTSS
jgi:hypothetical protein